MEMNLGYKNASMQNSSPKKKSGTFLPVYLCFMVFGILISLNKSEFRIAYLFLSILVALFLGLAVIQLLIFIFNSGNKVLRQQTGGGFAREAVSNGMFYMIPFTILAALAQLILGWDTVMSFASAAIMTAAASSGIEVMKAGAQGIKNVLLPSVIAFMVSTVWMLLVGILP